MGLAYEVSGDTAVDRRQVRRYREKFGIPFPLLLAGVNDTEAAAATLPQLQGFTSFPTTIFLGRDGKVRRIHAGFYGPATGAQHAKQVRDWEEEVERLLEEKAGAVNGERVNGSVRDGPRSLRSRFTVHAFSLTPAVVASGSTLSPIHSPASAWPGTPQSSQYQPASSASNVVRSA